MNVLAFYNVYYTAFRVENKCMPQEHDTPSNVETLFVGPGKVAASGPCPASAALPFPSRKPVASS